MAKTGDPLPDVLAAGEWRSVAILNYTQAGSFHEGTLLHKVLAAVADEYHSGSGDLDS